MTLSPTARTLLTALMAALSVLAVSLPTLGAPLWVGIAIGVVTAFCAALGIVPPQTGGTQQGVVSPGLTEPPDADIEDAEGVQLSVDPVEVPAALPDDPDAVVPAQRADYAAPSA